MFGDPCQHAPIKQMPMYQVPRPPPCYLQGLTGNDLESYEAECTGHELWASFGNVYELKTAHRLRQGQGAIDLHR